MFVKATKKQAKLRLTFDGPAGSGKTYSSLVLAKALGGRTALIDTEHGSASKYANLFDFDVVALKEFSLDTYMKAIAAAGAAKYDVLVIDSLTHAWTGKGGALEQVDSIEERQKFTKGWRTVSPLHTRLIDSMLSFPGHLITTMRTKMEYVLVDKGGKQVPQKLGMAPVQREGMEYEFDVVVDLDLEGHVSISKSRCPTVNGPGRRDDVPDMGLRLKAWLTDGEPVPEPKPTPPAPPASDWSTDGAPVSPVAQLEVALAETQTKADLDKLVDRIRRLTKAEQDAIRPLFGAALERINVTAKR